MKSEIIIALVFVLSLVTVEAGVFDFFNGFYDKDVLRPFNPKEFEKDLRKSLYGQHIALETILKAVTWFIKDPNPPKPLVLSLHGPTGVGKTYVTKIIARNIYEMGEKSKHIHTFRATYHFLYKDQTKIYKDQLKEWIHGNVSQFSRSMFIFDQMESMNPHLIDTIKPFLDNMRDVKGVSFHNAAFIFLSQAGGTVINNLTLDFWRKGKGRNELWMNTMETYQNTFNDKKSGFWHSSLIDRHLVDHFIPFLPLELKHVKQCVLAEMVHFNISAHHHPDLAETVAREMPFFPSEVKIFSVKGCKSVRSKLVQHG